jgi:hypothetical protein
VISGLFSFGPCAPLDKQSVLLNVNSLDALLTLGSAAICVNNAKKEKAAAHTNASLI